MDHLKIDNLWKFLAAKNRLDLHRSVQTGMVVFTLTKGPIQLKYSFSPQFHLRSSLLLMDKDFSEEKIRQQFVKEKKVFGMAPKMAAVSNPSIFFPEALLSLENKHSLKVEKDTNGLMRMEVFPFSSENIWEVMQTVNLLSSSLGKGKFFLFPEKK